MAEPGLVDADLGRRRVALDLRTHHRAEAANDNRQSLADRLVRLWPVSAALVVLGLVLFAARS